MKGIRNILLLLIAACTLQAQTDSVLARNASGKTLKRLGKSALRQDDPTSAITFFEAYLRNNREDAAAMALLGEAYMKVRDYENAQRAFLRAYSTNRKKAPESLYYHALMQKSNGKYDSARTNFQKFRKEYKGAELILKKQAKAEIALCDSVERLMRNERKIVIRHLDSTVNKINAEGAPLVIDDSTLLFSSYRTDAREYIIEDDTAGQRLKKLYLARLRKGEWTFAGEYGQLNDDRSNNGNASLSPDGKRLYFTRCRRNLKEEMICAIYISQREGNGWSEPVKLPEEINNRKYTSTMPAVARDPAKGHDILYFVSNRRKGRGKLDIWYAVWDAKAKKFKAPRNAGSKINTAQNEITPFFDVETRSLYFSSDGWSGLGGYDVFRATGDGKRWAAAENAGPPLNTGADDIYYSISPNRGEGFFVSNRKGSRALKNSTCCDDIYHYRETDYIFLVMKGTVLDDTIPVKEAIIDIYLRDQKTQEKFLVKSTTSDSAGNYTSRLEPDKDYSVVVRQKDYLASTDEISTRGENRSKDITRKVKVTRKPKEAVRVANVQYEFGRADLNAESKRALELNLLKMMNENPDIIVEVSAHTDSKGSDAYNLKLSQKRADNIAAYMISKGIHPKRIIGVGYGESKPIAANENPDGSDNPEGRALNRRTEFKIVGTAEIEELEETEEQEREEKSEKSTEKEPDKE